MQFRQLLPLEAVVQVAIADIPGTRTAVSMRRHTSKNRLKSMNRTSSVCKSPIWKASRTMRSMSMQWRLRTNAIMRMSRQTRRLVSPTGWNCRRNIWRSQPSMSPSAGRSHCRRLRKNTRIWMWKLCRTMSLASWTRKSMRRQSTASNWNHFRRSEMCLTSRLSWWRNRIRPAHSSMLS